MHNTRKLKSILNTLQLKVTEFSIDYNEYIYRKKNKLLGNSLYCRKVKNHPFGKGELKNVKMKKNKVYLFAKGYAFYFSQFYGLVKIMNMNNDLQYSYKIVDKKVLGVNEDKLILVKDREESNDETRETTVKKTEKTRKN